MLVLEGCILKDVELVMEDGQMMMEIGKKIVHVDGEEDILGKPPPLLTWSSGVCELKESDDTNKYHHHPSCS